jgi:hypothetical protein
MKDLVAKAAELSLEPQFLQNVDEELKRFTLEIRWRKNKEEEDRLELEAKLLAKKKKKK